jgi:hypothetical protein
VRLGLRGRCSAGLRMRCRPGWCSLWRVSRAVKHVSAYMCKVEEECSCASCRPPRCFLLRHRCLSVHAAAWPFAESCHSSAHSRPRPRPRPRPRQAASITPSSACSQLLAPAALRFISACIPPLCLHVGVSRACTAPPTLASAAPCCFLLFPLLHTAFSPPPLTHLRAVRRHQLHGCPWSAK